MQEILNKIREIYSTDGFIPLHEPRFIGQEIEYVLDCIKSTFVSSVGQYVDRFEKMLADFTGAKHAIAVVNGTQALFVALELAGVEPNCEVITQSLSFVATANAIMYHHANPVFIDVDRDTMGMSPGALQNFLGKFSKNQGDVVKNSITGRRIAAIVPMHTLGHACRIEEIVSIADKFGIPVVEDAAESLGTTTGDRHTGTLGLLGTLSFNGNKLITTGGGGMILTNDSELACKAKHITTTAKIKHQFEFIHDEVGYNFRLPNLNAALGVAQMEKLSDLLKGQRELAIKYRNYFANRSDVDYLEGCDDKNMQSNFWINAILWHDPANRTRFLEFSNNNKVMTRPFWKPLHNLPMYMDCYCDDLAVTEYLYDRVVHISSSVPLAG